MRNEWWCPDYLSDRRGEITGAVLQHLAITVASVVVGLVVAFALALAVRRVPRLAGPIQGVSTGLYTVPSLALFPLLVPFTGLTVTTVVIGLALYALTILVRAFLRGFDSVPASVRESARGLGYSPGRMLWQIELPLALPIIFAGLRVAVVSTVALTTIGALVSYGGLGNLLVTGVDSDFRAQILVAAVGCVLIAVVLDLVVLAIEWLVTPWRRGRVEAAA